ncbi:MAG: polysaccharide biosynthesis C-terminal domain-containing protein [Clostridium sp.]|jgi:putative MATE family efflux protein|nr:polysaccharide biosynthesis C-terminal domain-containing protein [Clostridium sp.]
MDNIKTQFRKKNLLCYTLPSVVGMCGMFLYIVVDGIFVGRGVGVDALGAVNLALPFTLFMGALCSLMTSGGITITAIRLGRGDERGANDAFCHAALLAFLIAVIMMTAGLGFPYQVAALMGANSTFLDMVADYIFYYSAFSLPMSLGVILQGFVRNDGSPGLAGTSVLLGALMNVFLDWLFIFPLQMGIKGAAVATGLGQISVVLILLTHFIRRKGTLRFGRISFSLPLIGKIIKRGLPEMLAQFSTPVTTLCMNYVLIRMLGDLSASAFSVMSYMMSFLMGVFLGVSEGLQPLIGQSYGKKSAGDLRFYFRSGVAINLLASLTIYVFLLVCGEYVYPLFNSNPYLLKTVAAALPKFGWAFLPVALNLMIGSYLYSTKRTAQAIVLMFCRCIAFNSVLILFLPRLLGSEMIWYTAGFAELSSFLIGVVLLKHSERNGVVFRS